MDANGQRFWMWSQPRDWPALDGTAVSRAVETRALEGELLIVTRGLDLSDKVIDALGQPLREGERVREERR